MQETLTTLDGQLSSAKQALLLYKNNPRLYIIMPPNVTARIETMCYNESNNRYSIHVLLL